MVIEMFVIEVSEIRGKCPVYKKGDKMVIEGPEIVLEKTDAICIHALASLLHYVVALRDGADPRKLGLSKDGRYAYIQCMDPGEPYTEGGTVIFKCYRVDKEKKT
ncbi:MAG: TIGR04076 family protein [Methanophagales archaeon]|nr:TIGR04076 family protein [Methanophagales archaeon]